jgi:hypothetical protein
MVFSALKFAFISIPAKKLDYWSEYVAANSLYSTKSCHQLAIIRLVVAN